jgi:hypothetical protein
MKKMIQALKLAIVGIPFATAVYAVEPATMPSGQGTAGRVIAAREPETSLASGWQTLSLADLNRQLSQTDDSLSSAEVLTPEVTRFAWQRWLNTLQMSTELSQTERIERLQLIAHVGGFLRPEQRQQLRPVLSKWFELKGFQDLSFDEMKISESALSAVGVPQTDCAKMVVAWLGDGPAVKTMRAADLAGLDLILRADASEASRRLQTLVAEEAWTGFLASDDYLKDGKLSEIGVMLEIFGAGLSPQDQLHTRTVILDRVELDPKVLAALDAGELLVLDRLLGRLAAPADQLATLLTKWANSGPSWNAAGETGKDLGPNAAVVLRIVIGDIRDTQALANTAAATVMGENGGPRSAALAAASFDASKQITSWQIQLDAAIKATPAGDKQAGLILSRACSEVLTRPASLGGVRSQVDWALDVSSSDALRLTAVGWMLQQYMSVQDFESALAMLRGVEKTIVADRSKRQIVAWEGQVARQQDVAARWGQVRSERLAAVQLQGQLAFLRQRLADARASGKSAQDLASLEQVIHNTENRITSIVQ